MYFLILSESDGFEEAWIVFCPEGRQESAHLIDDATQSPDVALIVILFVFPDFRTGVVGGSSLRCSKSIVDDL